jgi:hypothetical protein
MVSFRTCEFALKAAISSRAIVTPEAYMRRCENVLMGLYIPAVA